LQMVDILQSTRVKLPEPYNRLKEWESELLKMKLIFWISFVLLLVGCSETPELVQNNNPDKYTVAEDVHWTSVGGSDLTMDIYSPTSGRDSYPVLVIFHGGGFLINDQSIMDQMSKYVVTNGEYVVCNVNYRLLGDNDNTVLLNEIVEDVFGSVLWIKEHIGQYKGDNTKIAVTGDSAGGHLSAMIVNLGEHLSSNDYSISPHRFNPSYLPVGKTAEDIASDKGLSVQAAILSYGVFDMYNAGLNGFEKWSNPFWLFSLAMARGIFGEEYNAINHPGMYKTVSPIYHIPSATQTVLPLQLLTVGSEDSLVTPESVKAYRDKLIAAGQKVQYWEHEGRGHAYLDSGSSMLAGRSFENDATEALDVMLSFLDTVFYPE
jgi:acetyl esterase